MDSVLAQYKQNHDDGELTHTQKKAAHSGTAKLARAGQGNGAVRLNTDTAATGHDGEA